MFTAILTGAILLFLLIVLGLIAWRMNGRWDESPRGWQLFGMVFFIGFASVLMVAGYGANQLAAFSGFFGAALGYLFGKGGSRRPPSATQS